MGAVAELCSKAIVLESGSITYSGRTDIAISCYLDKYKSSGTVFRRNRSSLGNGNQFVSISNVNSANKIQNEYGYTDEIKTLFELSLPKWNDELEMGLFLCDKLGQHIFMLGIPLKKYYSGKRYLKLAITIPPKILTVGEYSWEAFIHIPLTALLDHQKGVCGFSINETGSPLSKYAGYDCGHIYPPECSIERLGK
jgi:lipopolysaccharide transport system ATP-binding protein